LPNVKKFDGFPIQHEIKIVPTHLFFDLPSESPHQGQSFWFWLSLTRCINPD
jgi:hypothetical protein